MAEKAFKPCEGCPSKAACKKAGKCMMKEKKMAKGGKVPALAIMIGVPAPMKKKAKK